MSNDTDFPSRIPFNVHTLKWVDIEADPSWDHHLPDVLRPACLEVRSASGGCECAVPRCDNRVGHDPRKHEFREFTLVAAGDRVIVVCPGHSPSDMYMHYRSDDDAGIDVLEFLGRLGDTED